MTRILLFFPAILATASVFRGANAFTARPSFSSSVTTTRCRRSSSASSSSLSAGTTTVEPPVREKTDRKTDRRTTEQDDDGFLGDGHEDGDYPDLEYLIDSAESREMEDPFHILLLGTTFLKPKVTVSYCAGSLEYVLSMPRNEAMEQSKFAQQEGMSCLGTWPREECLTLGRQLQVRDLECRVVPFVEGGQRGWQAKDASSSSSASNRSAENYQ